MFKLFRSYLPSVIAPIVAAARCFVSAMGMQRLQRIAGLAMIREETLGSKSSHKKSRTKGLVRLFCL
ncbi:MAG: hypothetical protein WCL14_12200 [Bacteroidota bacterium]